MRISKNLNEARSLRFVAVIIGASTLAMLCSSPLLASWKKVFQNPQSAHAFRAASFVDEQFGVIGGEAGDGTYRTTDGGKLWTNSVLPGQPFGNITQIKMLDRAHGWLSIETDQSMAALYETVDSAKTWVANVLSGLATDFYVNQSSFIITSRDVGRPASSVTSIDGGLTWNPNSLDSAMGIDFVDKLHGVVTGYISRPWYRTVDGGATWSQIAPIQNIESWSVYAVNGKSTFYSAGEGDYDHIAPVPTSVLRSTDYGATWSKAANLSFRTTGHITGVGEVLYVQADSLQDVNTGTAGLFRSMDKGRTWTGVGGPSNLNDTRFTVFGPKANIIYAFDAFGGVWVTDDGGDGTLATAGVSSNGGTQLGLKILSISPNPAEVGSSDWKVGFEIVNASKVSLDFTDERGAIVRQLALGEMQPGMHSTTMGTGDLRPGTYFLSLMAGSERISQRFEIR